MSLLLLLLLLLVLAAATRVAVLGSELRQHAIEVIGREDINVGFVFGRHCRRTRHPIQIGIT
jgi:hypothetical protein